MNTFQAAFQKALDNNEGNPQLAQTIKPSLGKKWKRKKVTKKDGKYVKSVRT